MCTWQPANVERPGVWVNILVRIRNNATKEVRTYPMDSPIYDGESQPNPFIWEEGNFACDCNRQMFFEYAGCETVTLDPECGDDRFSVALVNPTDGQVFYDELGD